MGIEQGSGPDESQRVEDVDEAQAMAKKENFWRRGAVSGREKAEAATTDSEKEEHLRSAKAWDSAADVEGKEAQANYRAEKAGILFPVEGERKGAMLRVGGEWFRIRGKSVGTPKTGWLLENANGEKVDVALDDPKVEAETDDYGFERQVDREGI